MNDYLMISQTDWYITQFFIKFSGGEPAPRRAGVGGGFGMASPSANIIDSDSPNKLIGEDLLLHCLQSMD